MDISEVMKILGDETRLRILFLLTKQELCVCLIEETLGLPQTNISKHLNRLRQSGMIISRRIAQWNFYSINQSFKDEFGGLFEVFVGQLKKNKNCADDMRKLEYLLETNDCCKKLLQQSRKGFNTSY
jgi:ArsR family transcriptional regulator